MPIRLIETFTVPPVGDVPLTEAKAACQGKIIFINCPPYLAYKSREDVRQGYLQLLDKWGDERQAIEYVEDLPSDDLEPHLCAALDACGH